MLSLISTIIKCLDIVLSWFNPIFIDNKTLIYIVDNNNSPNILAS